MKNRIFSKEAFSLVLCDADNDEYRDDDDVEPFPRSPAPLYSVMLTTSILLIGASTVRFNAFITLSSASLKNICLPFLGPRGPLELPSTSQSIHPPV